jgi:hypothetical protein
MKIDTRIVAILVFAAFITIYGVGSFLVNTPPDAYYDYSLAPIGYAANSSVVLTVNMQEKAAHTISTVITCNRVSAPCGQCGDCTITECSDGSKTCANPTPARSMSNFNARSIRVLVDGNEVLNTYTFPVKASTGNYDFSSRYGAVGEAYCWGFSGTGSCGQPDGQNLPPQQRAYVYSSGILGSGTAYNGETFNIVLPSLALSEGNHSVDVIFYAETMYEAHEKSGYYASLTYGSLLNGWTNGDKNDIYNTRLSGVISVPVSTLPPVVPPIVPPVEPPVTPPVTPPTEPPTIPPLAPSTTSIIMLLAVGAGAYFVYTMWIKKK